MTPTLPATPPLYAAKRPRAKGPKPGMVGRKLPHPSGLSTFEEERRRERLAARREHLHEGMLRGPDYRCAG